MTRTMPGRPARAQRRSSAPQPLLLAVTVAAMFSATAARAQLAGGAAIHGTATVSRQGSTTTVTTTNGAGTQHSAIDWQSFSVPAGTAARFVQPSASSTSINRVLGPDPSAIYGTLSSNGRLVLVNPAGITVGAGAVVDTAAFTASTLRMTDADAVAGRLRFGSDGLGGGALHIDGAEGATPGAQVVTRGGDVVLIAPAVDVGAGASVRSEGGAVLLAAGRRAEITGRGLEGIRLELQAPDDQALNLGALEGDAVGIFAGTLRHSGLAQASSASVEGGRVVLRASGDALVDGRVVARSGDRGGSIDVFGGRVGLLAGAELDASGDAGGGSIRVGGDFQGKNAAVPNAKRTHVDALAKLFADARLQGDGGRVIVWADEQTYSAGAISARGGASGGDGGFVEVSGKHRLAFSSKVDTRAPQGKTGTLLMDPDDIVVQAPGATPSPYTAPVLFADAPSVLALDSTSIDAATSNVVLEANGTIDINAAINIAAPGISFSAEAGNDLNVNAPIATNGGAITLVAGSTNAPVPVGNTGYLNVGANLGSSGGAITLVVDNGASEGSLNLQPGITVNGGAGTVTLQSNNFDVGGNSLVVSGAVTGTGSIVVTAPDVQVFSGGSVSRNGVGDLLVQADTLTLGGTLTSNGGGRVVLRNADESRAIQVGTASSAGPAGTGWLGLTAGELASISAGTVVFGSSTQTGAILVTNTGSPTAFNALSLITQGSITQAAAIGVANLNADGGSVQLTNAGNTVGQVSGYARSGNFQFSTGASALAIGTVDGQNGINVSASGSLQLTGGPSGTVTVSQAVSAGDVSITGASGLNVGASVVANTGGVALQATGTGANLVFNPVGGINVKGTSALAFSAAGAVNFSSGSVNIGQSVASTDVLHILTGGTIGIGGTVTLQNVDLAGGRITNAGAPPDNLTIAGNFTSSGGQLFGNQPVVLAGTSSITGSISLDRPLTNTGSLVMSGNGFIAQGGAYAIVNNGTWDVQNTTGGGVSAPLTGSFTNNNLLKFTGGSTNAALGGGTVSNGTGGTIIVSNGMVSLGMLSGTVSNAGVFEIASGSTALSNAGAFNNTATGTLQGDGTLTVQGGSGALNNAGTIAPGTAGTIGTLAVGGNLNQSGVLKVDMDATTADQLAVSGAMVFNPGSTVVVNPLATPLPGTYAIASGLLPTGTLPTLSGAPAGSTLQFGSLDLVVPAPVPPAPPPPPPAPPAAPVPPPPAAAPAPGTTVAEADASQQQLQTVVSGLHDVVGTPKDDKDKARGRDDIVVTDTACKRS